jgi:HK97 family phage prohead protease
MTMKKDYIEDIQNGERRMFSAPIEVRKDGDAEYFEGMAVPFGQVTDLGYFSEEISKDAFSDVLNDDVRGLFNHDPDVVLGRSSSGTMTLTVNDKGVFYRIKYNPNDPDHVRVMEKVKRGDVKESSYAFSVKDEKWSTRDGKQHRNITKLLRWYDIAPVTYPANQNTTVAKRSLDNVQEELKKENDRAARQRQIAVEIDRIKLGIYQ